MSNITRKINALRGMTPKELRARYAEVFGEESRSGNREHLVKRIAWRVQALAEGGLSDRARRRAEQLARDTDIRLNAPKTNGAGRTVTDRLPAAIDGRLPPPGTVLTRKYKAGTVHVTVLERGFEFDGEVYRSLSAVAKAITGSRINGYHFFRLGKYAP